MPCVSIGASGGKGGPFPFQPAGAFFCTWFSVVLIVLTAQSMGLLIGANVINPKNGQTIATIFMLSTMLVGEAETGAAACRPCCTCTLRRELTSTVACDRH